MKFKDIDIYFLNLILSPNLVIMEQKSTSKVTRQSWSNEVMHISHG